MCYKVRLMRVPKKKKKKKKKSPSPYDQYYDVQSCFIFCPKIKTEVEGDEQILCFNPNQMGILVLSSFFLFQIKREKLF